MTPSVTHQIRERLSTTLPHIDFSVRSHGSPVNAPSVAKRGAGYIAFRGWNRVYITVSPGEPMSSTDADTFDRVVAEFRADHGSAVVAGPDDSWPYA